MTKLAKLLTALAVVGVAAGLGAVPSGTASASAPTHSVRALDTGWD